MSFCTHGSRWRLSVFPNTGVCLVNRIWHLFYLRFAYGVRSQSIPAPAGALCGSLIFISGFRPNFATQGGARLLDRRAEDRKAGAPREAEEEEGLRNSCASAAVAVLLPLVAVGA